MYISLKSPTCTSKTILAVLAKTLEFNIDIVEIIFVFKVPMGRAAQWVTLESHMAAVTFHFEKILLKVEIGTNQ